MARLEEREVDVRVDPVGAQQPLLRADQREIVLRGGGAAGGELRLAQADDVLRQRQAGDDVAVGAHRGAQPAISRRDGGQAGQCRDVAGEAGERRAVRVRGLGEQPALELEVAQERLHVGAILGDVATGRDSSLRRCGRACEVTVQLAPVGHARVRGQVRLGVDPLLERAVGLTVAAQLDQAVDDDCVRSNDVGRQQARLRAKRERGAEVVAREGELAGDHGRLDALRRQLESRRQHAVGPRVERRIARLADLLQVRLAELGVAGRVAWGRAHRRLQRSDARVGGLRSGRHERRRRGSRHRPAAVPPGDREDRKSRGEREGRDEKLVGEA